MKFDFSKSTDADFRNKLQSDIFILMKNVLYLTHAVDRLNKNVTFILNNSNLQKQVDEYFDDDDKEDIPDSDTKINPNGTTSRD